MKTDTFYPIVHLLSYEGRRVQRPATSTLIPFHSAAAEPAPVTVEQAMNRQIVALLDSASLRQALDLFRTRNISGAPVLDDEHRLVGIITSTDLLSHMLLCPDAAANGLEKPVSPPASCLQRPVRDYMSRELVTVAPEASLMDACALLRIHGIRRLIVTRSGRIKGILTLQDALARMVPTEATAS